MSVGCFKRSFLCWLVFVFCFFDVGCFWRRFLCGFFFVFCYSHVRYFSLSFLLQFIFRGVFIAVCFSFSVLFWCVGFYFAPFSVAVYLSFSVLLMSIYLVVLCSSDIVHFSFSVLLMMVIFRRVFFAGYFPFSVLLMLVIFCLVFFAVYFSPCFLLQFIIRFLFWFIFIFLFFWCWLFFFCSPDIVFIFSFLFSSDVVYFPFSVLLILRLFFSCEEKWACCFARFLWRSCQAPLYFTCYNSIQDQVKLTSITFAYMSTCMTIDYLRIYEHLTFLACTIHIIHIYIPSNIHIYIYTRF